MHTMTVCLSPQQATRIQQAVEAGNYASHSEVLHDALGLWIQREEIRALEIGKLKAAYDAGKASGTGREVDAERLLAKFRAKAAGPNGSKK